MLEIFILHSRVKNTAHHFGPRHTSTLSALWNGILQTYVLFSSVLSCCLQPFLKQGLCCFNSCVCVGLFTAWEPGESHRPFPIYKPCCVFAITGGRHSITPLYCIMNWNCVCERCLSGPSSRQLSCVRSVHSEWQSLYWDLWTCAQLTVCSVIVDTANWPIGNCLSCKSSSHESLK